MKKKKAFWASVLFWAAFALVSTWAPKEYNPAALFVRYSPNAAEQAGNAVQLAVPLSAATYVLLSANWVGAAYWAASVGTTAILTHGLKAATKRKRPDTEKLDSFPSAHTSFAFSGASFWQGTGGWSVGAGMYAAAAYVAWSRVHANRHHAHDVIAGALLAIAVNLIFWRLFRRRLKQTEK
ncbi:MAG: phosphatase PAP2 family protein [Rickettsiales bacterium]|jgi:membrane-associated phospholipid phosphatase|nr:phosphatase PAP2 family protein [Rickettsiales bacterium]